MFRFSRLQKFQVAAAVVLVVLGVSTVYASEGGSNEGDGPSIQGVVSDVTGNTIKILGGAVVVDATGAAIVGENNNAPLSLADVKKGRMISVEGSSSAGVFHALRITVEGPQHDGSLSGPLDSVSTTQLSILGVSVTLTPNTIIDNNGNPNGTPAALTVGTLADVEVAVVNGALVATRISIGSGPDQNGEH